MIMFTRKEEQLHALIEEFDIDWHSIQALAEQGDELTWKNILTLIELALKRLGDVVRIEELLPAQPSRRPEALLRDFRTRIRGRSRDRPKKKEIASILHAIAERQVGRADALITNLRLARFGVA